MSQTLLTSMAEQPAYDGQPAQLIALTNANGMQLVFMDIGATWLSCEVPVKGEMRQVLLGVGDMEGFKKQTSFLGATVGRYANRIANSQFELNGKSYHLTANQAQHCLHGGVQGWSHLRWAIKDQQAQKVVFSMSSPDGDQGFPGNVEATVTFTLTDDNQVLIDYTATTDATTPINLTNHAYFNLMGADSGKDVLQDTLTIKADSYLPTDNLGIPLQQGLVPVEGTAFDFRHGEKIGACLLQEEQQKLVNGYDHSYYLGSPSLDTPVATVLSADKAITMNVFTNKPAIQLYTGNWLEGTPSRTGGHYQNYQGVALETQYLPDSPNRSDWPHEECWLEPGQTYQFSTIYQFK